MSHDYSFIRNIANQVGGSFYIFNKDLFKKNYNSFRSAIRGHYENAEVAYSFKANYMPAIGKLLHDIDGMGEVVSRLEYDIVRKVMPGEKVIFNGPIKTKEDIRYAILSGSFVNIDSFREISYLEELAKEFLSINIGLRVGFSIYATTSRFGFCHENGDFSHALELIKKIGNVNVCGLHSHFSTQEKSLELFRFRSEKMIEIAQEISLSRKIEYINIGGGFFGEMPREMAGKFNVYIPSFEEYAEVIGGIFQREYEASGPKLIIEPGISLIGNTMHFFAEVIEVRCHQGVRHALLDTSVNVINPTRSTMQKKFRVIKKNGTLKEKNDNKNYVVVGNTCMEHDVIDSSFSGQLEAGDFVVFANRGAYSNNYTPPFIMPSPAIIDEHGLVVKKRDTCESVIHPYAL